MSANARPTSVSQTPVEASGDADGAALPPRAGDPLVAAFTGVQAQPRIDAVRRSLDLALDDWWRRGALPTAPLLRDSLLLLEAGHRLDEAQRSLLLRAALAYRRGMLTALHYQTDPERTAVILAEALLEEEQPLPSSTLAQLVQSDEQSDAWRAALKLVLLQDAAHPDLPRRARVEEVLAVLENPLPAASGQPPTLSPTLVLATVDGVAETAPQPGRPWLRLGLLLLMLGVVAGAIWWQQRAVHDMAIVPAGAYSLRADAANAAPRTVQLAAFAIDNHEVTNAAYLRCVEQNVCAWPASTASATHAQYFLTPAFAHHPVVHVDWHNADRFCTFIGKRLPTADEWAVAAGFAPATQRQYRYPWGDQFLTQAANSGALGLGDTMAVGAYHPLGDSPLGLSDMAGNVAEWTATPAQDGAGEQYIVKGGSFRDEPAQLEVQPSAAAPAQLTAAWLGFRCAASTTQP